MDENGRVVKSRDADDASMGRTNRISLKKTWLALYRPDAMLPLVRKVKAAVTNVCWSAGGLKEVLRREKLWPRLHEYIT